MGGIDVRGALGAMRGFGVDRGVVVRGDGVGDDIWDSAGGGARSGSPANRGSECGVESGGLRLDAHDNDGREWRVPN